MLYVAMFDEVDEGTAIFKCTNRPPVDPEATFLTYEGLPSDHYLKLTGRAGQLFGDRKPASADSGGPTGRANDAKHGGERFRPQEP
jgi:hypothetical protein